MSSLKSYLRFLLYPILTFLIAACGGDDNDSPDRTPDPFSFTASTGVERETLITSDSVTIVGISNGTSISVTGGEYQINGGAFSSTESTINNGQSVVVRGTSSDDFETETSVTLTVGTASQAFTVTTFAQDLEPDSYMFTDVSDVELSTLTVSDEITVSGINDATPISISGGEFSIDGDEFVSTDGTVTNGQNVQVRTTSAAEYGATVDVTLEIGGVSDTFAVTTIPDTMAPVANIAFPPPTSTTEGSTVTVRGTASDDLSGVDLVQVNGIDATDTSGDGSFSTWQVVVELVDGDNALTVSVQDVAANSNTDADSVSVLRDQTLADFPDSLNRFNEPFAIDVDFSTNRAIIGDGFVGILAMDLTTGERELISDNTFEDLASPIDESQGVLIDTANNRVWVTDSVGSALFEVRLADGVRSVVSSNTIPNTDFAFSTPREMIVDPNNAGRLLLADGTNGITAVDILTGERTPFSTQGTADRPATPDANNPFTNVRGIVYEPERDIILVADDRAIVSVDTSTGARTVLSNNSIPNSDLPNFLRLETIALDAPRNRVLVSERINNAVIAVNLDTGIRSVFTSRTFPNDVNEIDSVTEVYFNENLGYAYLLDEFAYAIIAADVITGERVVVSRGRAPD